MAIMLVTIACQGSTGPVGPTGPQGVLGPTGLAGPAGSTGESGPSGLVGAPGPEGEPGVSGPPGPQGPSGPPGSKGDTGATGSAGIVGPQGEPGSRGPEGPQGPVGPAGSTDSTRPDPRVLSGAAIDVHTSLLSAIIGAGLTGRTVDPSKADDLIDQLDAASVTRAVVLSLSFALQGGGSIRAENNFVATEVAKYPERLVGFCGINPLATSALDEIERCLDMPGMKGVALHLPDSNIDLADARHVESLNATLGKAESLDAPVMLHLGTPLGLPLGARDREVFVSLIVSHPSLRIALAHCGGPVDEQTLQNLLQAFELRRNEFNPDNLFIDVSRCLQFFEDAPISKRELLVWRLRKWGLERVFFGSDYLKIDPTQTPIEALVTMALYPFTQEEIDQITSNDASAWLDGN